MSDRIADRIDDIRERLNDIDFESNRQEVNHAAADEALKEIAREDRERHGPTPTDRLGAAIREADECLNCGEPIEGAGGFCGYQCLTEYQG